MWKRFKDNGLRIGWLTIDPPRGWRMKWIMGDYCGIFRNLPHIKPGRWGFFFLGIEFGSRNPQNPMGVWLKRVGLWPW